MEQSIAKDDQAFNRQRSEQDVKALTHALAIVGTKLRDVALERDHKERGAALCWLENSRLGQALAEEQRQHEETRVDVLRWKQMFEDSQTTLGAALARNKKRKK